MNIPKVLIEKKDNNIKIKKDLGILLKYKPLWLIKITDSLIKDELIKGLVSLPAAFIICSEWEETVLVWNNIVITWNFDKSLISGLDFIICDDNISDLNSYLSKWITPIIFKDNHMSAILKEFNPVKNEWNSYLYDTNDKWSVFYTTVRYLENYKFPYDNKNLVKNILST